MRRLSLRQFLAVPAALLLVFGGAALAETAAQYAAARQAILNHYAALAKQEDPGFKGFSAAAGKAFFLAHPATARPATPSCSSCHTTNPHKWGMTRAGKRIAPVAVSVTPSRFTDPNKVELWFRRNCHSVYGRACTAIEKGNYITFMASQ
jgi:cytochrome c peroxidase